MSKKSKPVEGEPIVSTKEDKKDKKAKKEKKEKKEKQSKSTKTAETSAPKSLFAAPAQGVDDSLASLFSTNAGPVKISVINSRRPIVRTRDRDVASQLPGDDDDDEEAEEAIPSGIASALAARDEALRKDKKKKRKRTTEPEIEDVYMDKLRDEEPEPRKKQKKDAVKDTAKVDAQAEKESDDGEDKEMADANGVDADSASDNESDTEDKDEEGDGNEESGEDEDEGEDDDEDDEEEGINEEEPQERIRHETEGDLQNRELEKANCTVFVGNLPSTIITDKAQHKALQTAFKAHGPVSSIRFRSIAFSDQIPRKAAFITKALHVDQTTVNAYIVFNTPEAARSSLKLNGTVVLDHHIRVDSVAHPARNDSRKCVFVGNLDFEAAEESLWKHFGTCGKIENVRLVRDAKTNVGKGFAYVQFADEVDVEKALLLNDKPMQVDKGRKRKLRVTRAKNMRKKAVPDSAPGAARSAKKNGVYVPKADPRKSGAAGRAGKLFGKAGGAKMRKVEDNGVFEGTRAVPGMDVGLRSGGSGKKKGKARARKTVRSTAWKKKPAT